MAELRPGMVVARDVADGKGGTLLRRGVSLGPSYIRALEERDFAWVYISDEEADLLVVEEVVASYVGSSSPVVLSALSSVTDEAARSVGDAALEQEAGEVACVLSQTLSPNVVTALARMAAADQTLLYHGLNTAVVAVSLGIRMGFDEASLRTLALGSLLHDCGKTLLRDEALLLPLLSEEQLNDLRRHPLLGQQVARELGLQDQQAFSVIGQHHERQDGLGYPRGLRGSNYISSQAQSGRIALAAEIVSVADAYAVLTASTLKGGSLTPEQVALAMRRLAGPVLNRQIVGHFLEGARSVPLGVSVYVAGGRYAGCRGMVVRRSPADPRRVVVRLTQGRGGIWTQQQEVDLGEEPEARLAAVLT